MAEQEMFDPRGLLAALDRNYVSYVLIGGLARVIRGTDEITDGVDICPSVRPENLERLGLALEELEARRTDRKRPSLDEETLGREPVIRLRTASGELRIVPEPAGTRRGYDDLRRAATREHIGEGLRPNVASVADLARMSAALAHEHEIERSPGREVERLRELELTRSRALRRIMEVEVGLQRTLGRGIER